MVFEWTEEMKIDIKEMDDQHKKLIQFINELYRTLEDVSGNQETVLNAFDALKENAVEHFKFEEWLMTQHGYYLRKIHETEHNTMLKQLEDLRTKVANKKTNNLLPIQILTFLANWLSEHIFQIDKMAGIALKEAGAK